MTTALRLAAVQCRAEAGDVAANVESHVGWIEQAADQGAAVVLFPELSVTGYEPELIDLHHLQVPADDPRLDPIGEVCRRRGVHALVGAPVELEPQGLPRICLLHIDPTGTTTLAYAKIHLHPDETGIFGAGEHRAVLEVDGRRLGLAICFDASYAEHAQSLAADGAEVFLLSALYQLGAESRIDSQIGNANDAGLPALLAQYVGATGDGPACGLSGAWAADHTELSRLGREPGLVLFDLG